MDHARHLHASIPSSSNLHSSTLFFLTMLKTLLPRTLFTLSSKPLTSVTARKAFSQSAIRFAKDPKMPSGPPKHEMAYFPEMTSALPSKSGEFRRVLWTGLYSQVVLMTVPVGGDIGDEVGSCFFVARFTCPNAVVYGLTAIICSFTPSTKP